MTKRIDLTGKRYGRLVILSFAFAKPLPSGRMYDYWKCKCDCGTIKAIGVTGLRQHTTKSCGCYRKERTKLAKGEANFNQLYKNYKQRARIAGLIFLLSKNDFRKLTSGNCDYCNSTPQQSATFGYKLNGVYIYNGIDRVDNTKGYELNNCVPCCKYCNWMKRTLSVSEFLEHIQKILSHCKIVEK